MARIIGVTNVETEGLQQPMVNMRVQKKHRKLHLVSTQLLVFPDLITGVSLVTIKARIPVRLVRPQLQSLPPVILAAALQRITILGVISQIHPTWNWV